MKNNTFMSNNSFLSYGLGVFLYINTLFELKLESFGLKISEFCVIGILLFVLVFIFNEINKILLENYEAKAIKYHYETNYFRKYRNFNFLVAEKKFNKVSNIYIKDKNSYKVLLSMIHQ
jgi:hypothetical protein